MRPPTTLIAGLLAAAALLAAAGPAVAASEGSDAGGRLKNVERELRRDKEAHRRLKERSESLAHEVRALQRRMIEAASTIQDHEAKVAALEAGLRNLGREEAEKSARLVRSRAQFAGVLDALQRIARRPPETLVIQPISGADMVRSAILLKAAVPRIEARAEALRGELLALDLTRRQLDRRRAELVAAAGALAEERTRLDTLIDEKRKAQLATSAAAEDAEERIRNLAREATSLREFMKELEAEEKRRAAAVEARIGKAPPAAAAKEEPPSLPARGFAAARGSLPYPAVGQVVGHYGQALDSGLTRKGIIIETVAGAQVVAPHGGRVAYAGQFRAYGQLLIIEHGEGYHSLLAGMARIDSDIGQMVSAGEPVGVMGQPRDKLPTLYMELRREGQPINPLPWLAARKNKVSG